MRLRSEHAAQRRRCLAYMLNTRGERIKYGILFIFSVFCEYSNLEYVHIHVVYRLNHAEYGIRILVAASQEYVNTYSARRLLGLYTILPLRIFYGVWHTQRGSGGRRILRNGRATVLQ